MRKQKEGGTLRSVIGSYSSLLFHLCVRSSICFDLKEDTENTRKVGIVGLLRPALIPFRPEAGLQRIPLLSDVSEEDFAPTTLRRTI